METAWTFNHYRTEYESQCNHWLLGLGIAKI